MAEFRKPSSCLPNRAADFGIVLITDPGPDPDDIKTLLIAGVLHRQKEIVLHAVVANGGQQATQRAQLVLTILHAIGVRDVPVGVGSAGQPYAAQPHEFNLPGFDEVDTSLLVPGQQLLLNVLRLQRGRNLTFVSISSLRDLADLVAAEPDLFVERTRAVSVMGGLEWQAATSRWLPDQSVNNLFDSAGAAALYNFCFDRGVPLTVVSRNAVPMLPMQLAKSFAVRTHCPVMMYLADSQFLGLAGLWQKLCEGKLPPRCSKRWYFETFCGVDAADFVRNGFEALSESANIISFLNGFVKPYDVIALMAVLPLTRTLFERQSAAYSCGGVTHTLLLEPAHLIDAKHVLKLLRTTFIEVVVATRLSGGSQLARGSSTLFGARAKPGPLRALLNTARSLCCRQVAPHTLRPSLSTVAGERVRGKLRDEFDNHATTLVSSAEEPSGLVPSGMPRRRSGDVLEAKAIAALLERALTEAREGQMRLVQFGIGLGVAFLLATFGLFLVDRRASQLAGGPPPAGETVAALIRNDVASMLGTSGLITMALSLQPTKAFLPAVRLTMLALCVVHFAFIVEWLAQALEPGVLPSPRLWESASFNCTRLLCIWWLLSSLAWRWRRVRPLMLSLGQTLGFGIVCESLVVLFRRILSGELAGSRGQAVVVVTLVRTVYKLLLGLPLLWPGTHRRVRALFSSSARRAGLGLSSVCAPIAPILGFGSTHEAEVSELMADVDTCFYGAPLDSASLAELAELTGTRWTAQAGLAPRRSLRRSASEPLTSAPLVRSGSLEVPADGRRRRRSTRHGKPEESSIHAASAWYVHNTKRALVRAVGLHHSSGGEPAEEAAEQPEEVDFYVVHSWHDPMDLKLQALQAWAALFEASHGRKPVVWMDALCADPSLRPYEHLQHMPVYLAKSKRLLLLAGPTVCDRLWAVMELYLWVVVGGSVGSVLVLPLGDAAMQQKVVASFDAFAVMYARAKGEEDMQRLVHAVEIAVVSNFNDTIRSYCTAVAEAMRSEPSSATQPAGDYAAEAVTVPVARSSPASGIDRTSSLPPLRVPIPPPPPRVVNGDE